MQHAPHNVREMSKLCMRRFLSFQRNKRFPFVQEWVCVLCMTIQHMRSPRWANSFADIHIDFRSIYKYIHSKIRIVSQCRALLSHPLPLSTDYYNLSAHRSYSGRFRCWRECCVCMFLWNFPDILLNRKRIASTHTLKESTISHIDIYRQII